MGVKTCFVYDSDLLSAFSTHKTYWHIFDNMNIDIIDSHLHVYDLDLRSQFPNQNWSHSFPSEEGEKAIASYNVPQTLAKNIANSRFDLFTKIIN